ncbi:MAG: hypothetical protein J6M05_06380 [Cardiobacteriaceae bacterium]|nr:hypothetical protein [Cardiobacteriaceae bacterium]
MRPKWAVNEGAEDRAIAVIYPGSFSHTQVDANREVEVWAKTETKSSVVLDTENGAIYCIKATVGWGMVIGRPHLTRMDDETCRKEISSLRAAPPLKKKK